MTRQVSKSGVEWEPTQVDEHGRVLAVRVFTADASLPVWQIVQVICDAYQVKCG